MQDDFNITNNIEGVEPLDPISLEPIPNNLVVFVREIKTDENKEKELITCFNAQSLWNSWISQHNNITIIANPLNRQLFNASSIIYIQNFLETINRDERVDNYKIIKNKTLYDKILKYEL